MLQAMKNFVGRELARVIPNFSSNFVCSAGNSFLMLGNASAQKMTSLIAALNDVDSNPNLVTFVITGTPSAWKDKCNLATTTIFDGIHIRSTPEEYLHLTRRAVCRARAYLDRWLPVVVLEHAELAKDDIEGLLDLAMTNNVQLIVSLKSLPRGEQGARVAKRFSRIAVFGAEDSHTLGVLQETRPRMKGLTLADISMARTRHLMV